MKVTVDRKEAAQIIYDHLCRKGRLNPARKHMCELPQGLFTFIETEEVAEWKGVQEEIDSNE